MVPTSSGHVRTGRLPRTRGEQDGAREQATDEHGGIAEHRARVPGPPDGPRRSRASFAPIAFSTEAWSSVAAPRRSSFAKRTEQAGELVAKRPRLGIGEQHARELGALLGGELAVELGMYQFDVPVFDHGLIIPWSSSTSLSSLASREKP